MSLAAHLVNVFTSKALVLPCCITTSSTTLTTTQDGMRTQPQQLLNARSIILWVFACKEGWHRMRSAHSQDEHGTCMEPLLAQTSRWPPTCMEAYDPLLQPGLIRRWSDSTVLVSRTDSY